MRRLLIGLLLSVAVAIASPGPVIADSPPADPQQQLAVIDQIRAQLGSNLADAVAAQQQLRQSLQDNAQQQQAVQDKIDAVNARIEGLEAQIAEDQRHEALLAKRIDAERAQLRQLARAAYVSPGSVLVVLAESQSLSDLLTRISDLNVAGSRAGELKSALTVDLLALTADRKHEQAARDEQVTLRTQLGSQLAQLQALQAQQEQAVADLQVKIRQTQYEISRLNVQSAQLAQAVADMLQQQLDAIIAAAMQAVWAQVQLWLQSNNVNQSPASAGHSTQYRFIWPEPTSQISQRFGPTTLVLEPPYGGYPHFHTGIDLVAPFGSPVYAADDGVVALVGSSSSGYGNYVVIAHAGGLETLYGHLSTALVTPGKVVTQGTVVGMEGSTGTSTGPHLHFELRIGQRPVDPTPYLPPGPPSAFRA